MELKLNKSIFISLAIYIVLFIEAKVWFFAVYKNLIHCGRPSTKIWLHKEIYFTLFEVRTLVVYLLILFNYIWYYSLIYSFVYTSICFIHLSFFFLSIMLVEGFYIVVRLLRLYCTVRYFGYWIVRCSIVSGVLLVSCNGMAFLLIRLWEG